MMPAWLSYGPVDWTCDPDDLPRWRHDWGLHDGWSREPNRDGVCDCGETCRTETEWLNHSAKYIAHGTRAGQKGTGLTWRTITDEIERYDDGRGDPPAIDSPNNLGRTA